MEQYEITGQKNETFTIARIDKMEELPNMRRRLLETDKEPVQYWMARVTAGTRKKAKTIPCWRFNSGRFITML